MVVHADQARNHAAAGQVDYTCAIRRRRCGIGDGGDLALTQDDGAVVLRRSAGAVDHAHMRERDDGIVVGDEFLHLSRRRLRQRAAACDREQQREMHRSTCHVAGHSQANVAPVINA